MLVKRSEFGCSILSDTSSLTEGRGEGKKGERGRTIVKDGEDVGKQEKPYLLHPSVRDFPLKQILEWIVGQTDQGVSFPSFGISGSSMPTLGLGFPLGNGHVRTPETELMHEQGSGRALDAFLAPRLPSRES